MQQYVSLHISLPKIAPLQNGTKALNNMFLANQKDKAKIMPEIAKKKTNLQRCVSLHIALPQIISLQNDTQAFKIMFPAAKN